MTLKKLVVFLVIIVEVTLSQRISHLKTSRYKRNGAPTIVYGNADIQAQNNFMISQNASLPPGSQVIGGSIPTQARNQYLTIADSGKLVVLMPDMIQLPDPLVVLGLEDSQVDKLLNITHGQRNAQIIYNLKLSLHVLSKYFVKMTQTVDRHLLENQVESNENNDYHENIWDSSIVLHALKIVRLDKTLNSCIQKIKVGDTVMDSDVERARRDAFSVLTSHKKLAVRMQQVVSG